MSKNRNSIVISAPTEEVFGFAAEFENDPRWRSGVETMRFTSKRPVRVGARAVENARVLGQTMQTTTVIGEYEPNRRVAAKSVSGPVPVGTRMTYTLESDAGGVLLFRLMGPLLTRRYGKRLEVYLQTFKETPETKPLVSGERR